MLVRTSSAVHSTRSLLTGHRLLSVNVQNFINGKFEDSKATKWFDVSLSILTLVNTSR